MEDEAAANPGELLEVVGEIRDRVRARRSGRWFPLVVLAAVVLGSVPFYAQNGAHIRYNIYVESVRIVDAGSATNGLDHVVYVTCNLQSSVSSGVITYRVLEIPTWLSVGSKASADRVCNGTAVPPGTTGSGTFTSRLSPFQMLFSSGMPAFGAATLGADRGIYWLISLPIAFLTIGVWSLLRSKRRGMRFRWIASVASGVGTFALLIAFTPGGIATLHLPFSWSAYLPEDVVSRGITPLIAITASLFVYAWTERDLALSVFSFVLAGTCILVNLANLDIAARAIGLSNSSVFGVALAGGVLLLGGIAIAADNALVKRWLNASGETATSAEEISFA